MFGHPVEWKLLGVTTTVTYALIAGQRLASRALIAGVVQTLAGWLPVILQMVAVM
jgi:hypothetical protein